MMTSEQWLNRNFEITSRLFDIIGQNVLIPNFRPNWRTGYLLFVILFGMTECIYLLWECRSDLLTFLEILPNFLFSVHNLHTWVICHRRSDQFCALRSKLMEIVKVLNETKSNLPVIANSMRFSVLVQKCIVTMYVVASFCIQILPFLIWLVLHKKILIIVLFVPGVDGSTTEGFLINLGLHLFLMIGVFCGYTSHECVFLSLVMPVAAYVDAFANEVKELNNMLSLPVRDETAISEQLNRIVKLHQMLNEYEKMLEDLYTHLIMNKISCIFLGMISSVVASLKTHKIMPITLFVVQFQQMTEFCLMGTIITVKNEQLMGHVYDIDWYLLPKREAKKVLLMLHKAQNPNNVTIGKYKPLNVASYLYMLKSIYSYVMVLVTFIE